MKTRLTIWCGIGLISTVLGACSPQNTVEGSNRPIPATGIPSPAPEVCNSCGVVRSVTAVSEPGQTTGAGVVIGAIVGGAAGNQVGGGSGQAIATGAGAIGGALLGNRIEQNRNAENYFEVVVEMEGGNQQTIIVQDAGGINPGTQVYVQGGNISLR